MFETELLDFCNRGMNIFFMFKSVRRRVIWFFIIQMCVIVSFITICILFKKNLDFMGMFIVLFETELFITSLLFIRNYIRSYISKEYKIKFGSKEWYTFKYLLLKKFLMNKKILNKPNKYKTKNIEALDFCIERFEKHLERKNKRKFSTIVMSYSAILIAVFVPLWTAFNNWIYQKNNFELGQATAYFGLAFIILILVFLFWIFICHYCIGDILQLREQRIIQLIDMLNGIRFSLNNSHYLDEFGNEDINKLVIKVIDEYEVKKEINLLLLLIK
ncbi:hypothetical protein [Bacillus wiedmannii]|uniref:hypothetical protein n=1 Tax=Bacillus wiedmannii TaxID=1890302 RepID=UPI000B442C4E|nr:hypothetical protein [Bacillus wiedmannii]